MDIVKKIVGMKLQLKHCYCYTPEELWSAFVDYVKENSVPTTSTVYSKSPSSLGMAYEVMLERPLNIKAFCSYAQIATIARGWDNAIDEILRSDNPACVPYREVANLIADFVEAQVLEGGMLNKFNASLASNMVQGKYNKAYVQDAGGFISKIEHTINFNDFKDKDK